MRNGVKRALDFLLSAVGLVVLLPFFLLVAIAIKIDDRGPVFFRQKRIGLAGRPFQMWKFRTMVVDADVMGSQLTVGADPRITRFGHLLRRTKIDELPQLLNVVAGEMSLVGPRPEVPKYVALYDKDQRRVLELLPGITDPASIAFRSESELLGQASNAEGLYVEDIMPTKIRINLEYSKNATLFSDLLVIFMTVFSFRAFRFDRNGKFVWRSS